jgi:hypothetical protein
MPAHNHLLDLEMRDSIFDHARRIEVVRMHRVCDVAMHKNIARLAEADSGFGHAAVGTAYPQNLGRLALCELRERVRVVLGAALDVAAVAGEQVIEWIWKDLMSVSYVESYVVEEDP